MTELSTIEQKFVQVTEDLIASPAVTVLSSNQGDLLKRAGDAQKVFEQLASQGYAVLPEEMRHCFMRFRDVGAHWQAPDPESEIGGEFNLLHLSESIRMGPPPWHNRSEWSPEQQDLFSRFRIFDTHFQSGSGTLGSLRMMPFGVTPEIWFYDNTRGPFKLHINYCSYLDNIRITKGGHYWQYLFSDISLTEPGNTYIATYLRKLLDFLQIEFPDVEYGPLLDRLSLKTSH
ncbi:hypothetical protein GCM10011583_35320 [Streptomyces camponoticapitis]|uniref:Uncharacterized protein n=1 Tax=Streptomyces camponoticapitis TaxID=1616125 RepID=A0ABQ2E8D1_9ACTN|nr:hypothetical protein [Streptomyces camponoticapitis]GGK00766.1 hypothetical protein GCM10011583_35320 [Streptomyces camponoticapitis]